jgi:uncharacterized membrane protein
MKRLFTGFWKRLLAYFLAGLFTILPLVITIAVIVWVAGFIKNLIGPDTVVGDGLASMGKWMGIRFAEDNQTMAYVIGCVLVLASIFVLGVIVQMGFRKLLNNLVSPIIRSIPIAGSVYGAATQIVGLLEQKDESELKGMRVVYCVFGQENGTGLLALLPTPDRYPIAGRDYYIVYIPTSPVPMTGGLLFVPVESVHQVQMSVESLMSIYLSMGVTGPQFLTDGKVSESD